MSGARKDHASGGRASGDRALEEWADRVLSALPDRPAPPALELRVFEEIARREALPWWRRSFSHWPGAAQVAFVAGCAALVALLALGGGWFGSVLRGAVMPAGLPMAAANHASALLTAATEPAVLLANAIPSTWLTAALVIGTALYAALFALGAAAYRALYLKPSGQVTFT